MKNEKRKKGGKVQDGETENLTAATVKAQRRECVFVEQFLINEDITLPLSFSKMLFAKSSGWDERRRLPILHKPQCFHPRRPFSSLFSLKFGCFNITFQRIHHLTFWLRRLCECLCQPAEIYLCLTTKCLRCGFCVPAARICWCDMLLGQWSKETTVCRMLTWNWDICCFGKVHFNRDPCSH